MTTRKMLKIRNPAPKRVILDESIAGSSVRPGKKAKRRLRKRRKGKNDERPESSGLTLGRHQLRSGIGTHALRPEPARTFPSSTLINVINGEHRLCLITKFSVIPGELLPTASDIAARILANELRFKLGDELARFIAEGRRVISICNGFQVLVKTGFLPGNPTHAQTVTLAHNDSGRFQCHWVRMQGGKVRCSWRLNGNRRRLGLAL